MPQAQSAQRQNKTSNWNKIYEVSMFDFEKAWTIRRKHRHRRGTCCLSAHATPTF